MEGRKAELLRRIESDREVLLDFLRGFIRCRSPNPPGDTRDAAGHIRRFLERHGAEYRVIAPNEVMPNIVASSRPANPGVTDIWGRGLESYLQWFYETALLLHELLHENGSLYVHLDSHVVHHVKTILDEVFGPDNFRNEIIWKRASTVKGNFGQGSKIWSPNT